MHTTDMETEFVIFCIENAAAEVGVSGREMYELLQEAGAITDRPMNENPAINETLLQMKYARIVSLLARRLDVAPERALGLFYRSVAYACMSEKKYHLHNMSDGYIVDEIVQELAAEQ